MKRNLPGAPDPRQMKELAALARFPAALESNASYMLGELAHLDCPAGLKARIEELCGELGNLARALLAEARELDGMLGHRPGEEPRDAGIANPDPRAALACFRDRPHKVFAELNDLVRSLDQGGVEARGCPLAFVLVAESGANVLGAYQDALDAAERLEALLQESASRP